MVFFTRRRRLILFISAALILSGILLKQCFFTDKAPVYLTAPVRRGDIESSVLATGILKPSQLVAVGARATGRIISLKVRPGQNVKQGELLAEIDPTTQGNDLKSKEAVLALRRAGLAEQQARLALARKNMERQQNMLASHAVSKADYDAAEAQVNVALAQIEAYKAQIAQAETDIEMAQVDLGYTHVTAPYDGTILATVVQEGQNVNAVQSAPTILIMGNLSTMTVRAEISEADIAHVKVGQSLYFNTIGSPNRRYNGVLEIIEPAPESIRNDININTYGTSGGVTNTGAIYYNGLFNVDNRDAALRTYMTAEVHIILGRAHDALLVPLEALSIAENGQYKIRLLQKDGTAQERIVTIGLKTETQAEALSGLREGDIVIISDPENMQAESVSGAAKKEKTKVSHKEMSRKSRS